MYTIGSINFTNNFSAEPTANVQGIQNLTLKVGEKLNLSVPIAGLPKPTVDWKFNEKDIIGNFFVLEYSNELKQWDFNNSFKNFRRQPS